MYRNPNDNSCTLNKLCFSVGQSNSKSHKSLRLLKQNNGDLIMGYIYTEHFGSKMWEVK